VVSDPQSPPSFPYDGLVGFAGLYQSAINSPSWFQNLCDGGLVSACRFGLAYKTDNTGVQYFGSVEQSRFDGALSVAPVVPDTEWATWTDIALDGKVIEKNAMMVTDSGTTIIFGSVILKFFDPPTVNKPLFRTDSLTLPTDPRIQCKNSSTPPGSNRCRIPPQARSPATSAALILQP
jgi:hypothetical protein